MGFSPTAKQISPPSAVSLKYVRLSDVPVGAAAGFAEGFRWLVDHGVHLAPCIF